MIKRQNIFMLGIGGMGMAPLALYLKDRGFQVSGSDSNLRPEVAAWLSRAGIQLYQANIIPDDIDMVVYTSAIRFDHSARVEIRRRNIPELRRGAMLAKIAEEHRLIAVVGSHGKSTTAAMLVEALRRNGIACSYILGALYSDTQLPPARSSGEWLVAEIDESDGTIDLFSPELTLVVNLDWDHPDQYPSRKKLEEAFQALFSRTTGSVFLPSDCNTLLSLSQGIAARTVTYGAEGTYTSKVVGRDRRSQLLKLSGMFAHQEIELRATGNFNAHNATAALAVTAYLHFDKLSSNSLANFCGLRRRQSLLFESECLTILEDYAHHPAEIEALLAMAREDWPGRELCVVFQPHRYSRTLQYKEAFARALSRADRLLLKEVYAASEMPIEGGKCTDILKAFNGPVNAQLCSDYEEMCDYLDGAIDRDRVVLFVGAGDIDCWAARYRSYLVRETTHRNWWGRLQSRLQIGTVYRENEPLAEKTTLRVGGSARYYVEPQNSEDLSRVLITARDAGIQTFVLGRGSNIIVPDDGYPGIVIRLSHAHWRQVTELCGGRLWAGAGLRLKQLCAEARKLGMGGLEHLEGIPGSLGGSLRMNAGAMGGWIFDIVEEVELMTYEGRRLRMPREAFTVGYRQCAELGNAVALGAVIKPSTALKPEDIGQRMLEFAKVRKESQPREPSAGCVFKNPEGDYAGRLIDITGLKGKRRGGAMVSDVHGNFIVNTGGAEAADIIGLVREVRDIISQEHGVLLEPEVLLLGKSWGQVLA